MNQAEIEDNNSDVIINKDFNFNNHSNLYYYIYSYETKEYEKLKKQRYKNSETRLINNCNNNKSENLNEI